MSREFKFRAWHHGAGDPRVEGCMSFSEPFPVRFWERVKSEALGVEVMQFTGLQDCNGKDIYEGDIVDIGLGLRVIVFTKGRFMHGGKNTMIDMYEYECEIKGNVYETPELLT